MRNVINLSLSLFVLFLAGCRSLEHRETGFLSLNRMAEHVRIDSIVLHDSIFIREKSDTVFFTKYRTLYKERLLHDTVVKCDTVYVERTVHGEREHRFPLMPVCVVAVLFLLWRVGVFDLFGFLFKK